MPTKNKKNIRKIILKNFAQNNTSKPTFLNKNFPIITFSNEFLTKANKNNRIIKYRSQTESNIAINKTNLTEKNNIKLDSIPRNTYLNISPKKKSNDKKYILKNQIAKSAQKPHKNNNKNNKNNNISLSDLYKLPAILKNDYNTIKLHLPRKKSQNNYLLNDDIYTPKEKTLNIKTNSFNKDKNQEIKEMKERIISQDLTGINNNVDINIIDYNKICVKRNLRPVNIINRIPSSFEIKISDEDCKGKVQRYMKDRFYTDTESKMVKKLKNTRFNHDSSLKEKIIKMKEISGFWGGLADYCIPIFSIRKFEYIKERLRRQNTREKKTKNFKEDENKIKLDNKPSKLFTINSFMDYKHQKNLEFKKEFIEKYNDSLEYYMI